MKKISKGKIQKLHNLSNEKDIIAALAIDQRGSIMKMIGKIDESKATPETVEQFKISISKELTKYSSSILLDPEYGIPATKVREKNCGLIMAYEKTGYDANDEYRLPDLLSHWSAKRLADLGADAIKILLYYDVDEKAEVNDIKKAFVERVGSECLGLDIPYFLEIVTYDKNIEDVKSAKYAKVKPHKVIDAMIEFSKECYNVDVLKVEVPVNMAYVEGFANNETIYSKEEAKMYFKKQSEATDLPFIFLSAGVSSELFKETLKFAKESNSTFNGVLCGRATWSGSVEPFVKSPEQGEEFLKTQGKENITTLNEVLAKTATPWTTKIQ